MKIKKRKESWIFAVSKRSMRTGFNIKHARTSFYVIPLLFLVIATLACSSAWATDPVGNLEQVEYVRTIDGDTIVVRDERGKELHVNLIGIDAPELDDGTIEAFEAAAQVARALLFSPAVYLEHDASVGKDAFGHDFAWVWYEKPKESGQGEGSLVLLNEELVQMGQAGLYKDEISTRYRGALHAALAAVERAFEEVEVPKTDPCEAAMSGYDREDAKTWLTVGLEEYAPGRPKRGEVIGDYVYYPFIVANESPWFVDSAVIQVDFWRGDNKLGYEQAFVRNLPAGYQRRVWLIAELWLVRESDRWVY